MINITALNLMRYWILERDAILLKKKSNAPKPWSNDPIFQQYKFCNVRREDDRVTQWLRYNWRKEDKWDHPMFVPAMILARTINWPDTLQELGFPEKYDSEYMLSVMDRIQKRGDKVYTGAYMITAGPEGVRKNMWVISNAEVYFQSPPKIYGHSLQLTWESILNAKYPCVGGFIAGQVIADLKQTKHLKGALDWWDWAPLGPGSTRGLHRIHGRPIKGTIPQSIGVKEMLEIRKALDLPFPLCLQDIQNCLCEFDKYSRVRNGEGKPRSSYPGVTNGASAGVR